MRKRVLVFTTLAFLAITAVAVADAMFHEAKPATFDPAKTDLVSTGWIDGIGCPASQPVATYPATKPTDTYTDPACPTGDAKDHQNQGLLMSKVGPTSNNAAAQVDLKQVKGQTVTELGYDIRKPGGTSDPRGSHCGAGAPRFNVNTSSGTQFIGCNSPAPDEQHVGNGWLRLRWHVSIPDVQSIQVVFDEGQDTGPDNFGAAILDNIDVNGALVGRGDHGDQ